MDDLLFTLAHILYALCTNIHKNHIFCSNLETFDFGCNNEYKVEYKIVVSASFGTTRLFLASLFRLERTIPKK